MVLNFSLLNDAFWKQKPYQHHYHYNNKIMNVKNANNRNKTKRSVRCSFQSAWLNLHASAHTTVSLMKCDTSMNIGIRLRNLTDNHNNWFVTWDIEWCLEMITISSIISFIWIRILGNFFPIHYLYLLVIWIIIIITCYASIINNSTYVYFIIRTT